MYINIWLLGSRLLLGGIAGRSIKGLNNWNRVLGVPHYTYT